MKGRLLSDGPALQVESRPLLTGLHERLKKHVGVLAVGSCLSLEVHEATNTHTDQATRTDKGDNGRGGVEWKTGKTVGSRSNPTGSSGIFSSFFLSFFLSFLSLYLFFLFLLFAFDWKFVWKVGRPGGPPKADTCIEFEKVS